MQYLCTSMDMTDSPERDGKRVDLIVPIQQVSAGFTSRLTLPLGIKATSAGDVSSQALHIFIFCFASPSAKSCTWRVVERFSQILGKSSATYQLFRVEMYGAQRKQTPKYMQGHAQTYNFSSWGKFPTSNMQALFSR